MNKNKKILLFSLFGLDIAITVALFVISIVMLATMPDIKAGEQYPEGMIGYLQQHTGLFLGVVVVPLFILLVVNMVGLFLYVKKSSAPKKLTVNDLTEEQKAELLKEISKDIEKKEE